MYNSGLENNLISPDIADIMQDYCSIQLDIGDTKLKMSATVAQNIDIKKVIGKANLQRCIEPQTNEDMELRELVIPTWCYYTYYRTITVGQGTLTESGYVIEEGAASLSTAKAVANQIKSIAEDYMGEVISFLTENGSSEKAEMEKKNAPRIRTMGGVERRGNN